MNAMDFDDLLVRAVNVLELFPEVRERYQEAFRQILVDEYQDTNHVQYRWLELLAGERRNLTVVGDPDQSIYGFRGADIHNILSFEEQFPDAQGRQARAELPLDADDPRRRQRGDLAQPRAQGEGALDRARRRATRSRSASSTTSTRRRGSSPARSSGSSTRARRATRSRSSTGPTRSRACSRTRSCGPRSATR